MRRTEKFARLDHTSNIRPLRRLVTVRVLARPDTTKSGLVLAEVRGREDKGTVLRAGCDVQTVREGDVVDFDPYKVLLVITADGPSNVGSAYAPAGSLAILHEDSLRYVIE